MMIMLLYAFVQESGSYFYAQGCIRKIVADATCTPRGG